MRVTLVMLATLAGVGLSAVEQAAAKNLSCISEISPNEQRLLRDCEPTPTPTPKPIIYVLQVVDDGPPRPATIKNGEGGKGGGAHGRGHDHEAPAGGGGPNGAAN